MNKYMGFYELASLSIPTVPWRRFERGTRLDPGLLWTVRTAVENGSDTSLPRAVGVTADEAKEKGGQFLDYYVGRGIVIYYPYFIAEKSGVLDVAGEKTVIEAVGKDLWNLVSEGKRDVTIIVPKEPYEARKLPEKKDSSGMKVPSGVGKQPETDYIGNKTFLCDDEVDELLKYASIIRGRFREDVSEGRSIIAEWSYAYNTDIRHEPVGKRYLVFYELRSV